MTPFFWRSLNVCMPAWVAACLFPWTAPAAVPEGSRPVASRIQPRHETSTSIRWPDRIALVDPGSQQLAWAHPGFDDSTWKSMSLPVHWENAGLPGYDGVVWFRKHIRLSSEWTNQAATLSLGPIDDMDVTWINGRRVGGYETPGHHFTDRQYPIPPGTLQAGNNVIAIRVMDHGWSGGIAGQPGKMLLKSGRTTLPLNGAWLFHQGANLAALEASSTILKTLHQPLLQPRTPFTFKDGDVLAWAGGTHLVHQTSAGHLETLLTRSFPGQHLYFRNTAWQADTVYRQQRPLNFGSQIDFLKRAQATVILVNYGQMEALDGPEKIPQFMGAYEKMLDDYLQHTPHIILVTPYPFAHPLNKPHLPDLTRHNPSVLAYTEAIQNMARLRGLPCVHLGAFDTTGLTTDGIHLSPVGQAEWSRNVATGLLHKPQTFYVTHEGSFEEPHLEQLRQAIQKKNQLWRRFWRPTNWAFLYGDRQQVPSSHDHRPNQPRWFPAEINGLIPAIEKAESDIFNLTSPTP